MPKNRPILGKSTFQNKPINPGEPKYNRVIPSATVKPTYSKFTFSLRYFKQINYFQIGQQQPSWYISLIERLQELSGKDIEVFFKSKLEQNNFRYHEINWGGINVPIKRSELNWIDTSYLENEEEYPFVQFHVSKALGRVVGFWDENNVFQIVLLDPLHNIQPSQRNDYKVNDTHFLSSQISSILVDIENVKTKIKAADSSCETCIEVTKMPTRINMTNLLITHLDDDYLSKLNGSNASVKEILELGILMLPDSDGKN